MASATSLHPETRLGPVHLVVSDLQRSLEFYAGVLGLKAGHRSAAAVALTADGVQPLILLYERPDARPKPPRTTGLYHFAILLPARADLARALRRLGETRYPLQGASDHLVSEAVYLADPDDNGIEIYADRPRSGWPKIDGTLQMATDPLDVDGLLAELEDDHGPWEGVPAETRIGHIHLHVADLDAAVAFYGEVLGFDLVLRFGRSAAFLSAGGYHHHIGLNTWAGVGAPAPPADAVGLRLFTIILPAARELERVVARLREAGAAFSAKNGAVALRDPTGNDILLALAPDAHPFGPPGDRLAVQSKE